MSAEPDTSPDPAGRLLRWLPLALLAACLLALGFQATVPYDIWWQLANGRQAVESGHLVREDSFTFTIRGAPYLDKYWLFEIPAYLLYRPFGWAGMTALHLLLVAGVGLSAWFSLRREPRWAFLLMAVPALVLFEQRSSLRGYLVSFIFLPLFLRLARESLRDLPALRWGPLALLAGVQALWTNLHGEFLWGPLVAGALAIDAVLEARPRLRALAPAAGVVLAVCLATLVNPFGPALIRGVIEEAQVVGVRPVSLEWLPFARVARPLGWAAWIALTLLVGLSFVSARRRFRPGLGLLFLLAAVLSLRSFRFIGFMLLTGLFAGMENVGGAAIPPARGRRYDRAAALAVSPVLLLLFWAICTDRLYDWQGELRRFGTGIITSELPVDCSRYLRETGLRGNFLNDWSYGGYLIWHNGPEIAVAEDGRTAPFPRELSDKISRVFRGDGAALARFEERYDPDGAVVPWDDTAFLRLLAARGDWACLFVGMHSSVWMRRDSLARQGKEDLVPGPEEIRGWLVADERAAFEDEPWLTFPTAMYRRALFLLHAGHRELGLEQMRLLESFAPGHPLLRRLEKAAAE